MDPTQAFAATFVDELAGSGLRVACIAPGSRSAPLAMAFARHPAIRVFMHVDERSGSFFALGLAKATGAPVALLCTSGTAAAEFHAAVIEASYSYTPLLVLTADRPPELIGVGANQAVDQSRIYGTATRWFHDPGVPGDRPGSPRAWRRLAVRALAESLGPPAGPVHVNLPFREPLTPPPQDPPHPIAVPGFGRRAPEGQAAAPGAGVVDELARAFEAASRPLLVAGEMRDGARLREAAGQLARASGAPLLAEPSSQLRVEGQAGVVASYDALLRAGPWASAHAPDLVLRLGGVPTSKVLSQWLAEHPCRTVIVDPQNPWRDPDLLGTDVLRCDPALLMEGVAGRLLGGEPGWLTDWVSAGQEVAAALELALAEPPLFEGHAVKAMARQLPQAANVMVGSSMPIRDADTFWPCSSPGQRFFGNRGASGIDGLVSTGLGVAASASTPSALLLGDLSLYHDMNGLWALRRHGLRTTLVVLDNDGGGIFNFLPPADHADVFEELFGTPLGLRLEDVARLYGLEFCEVSGIEGLDRALAGGLAGPGSALVAVCFTRAASVIGHRACWDAVKRALA